jgi:plastocyanin
MISWKWLLFGTAVLEAAVLLVTGALLGDGESLALGLVVGATTAFLWWRMSRVALAVRALVFADVEFFMVPAAITDIAHHEPLLSSLPAVLLAVNSALGLIATVAVARGRAPVTSRASGGIAAAALAMVVVGLGLAAINNGNGDAPTAGDLQLSIKSAKFSSAALDAQAGALAVDVNNNDLFWHTFTIDAAGVSERIPVQGHHRVTMTLQPGVYRFYCAIPGHESIGMNGTLTVH